MLKLLPGRNRRWRAALVLLAGCSAPIGSYVLAGYWIAPRHSQLWTLGVSPFLFILCAVCGLLAVMIAGLVAMRPGCIEQEQTRKVLCWFFLIPYLLLFSVMLLLLIAIRQWGPKA